MKKYLILFIVSIVLLPRFSLAYTAVINVDTKTNSINAIEGTLVVPRGISISQIYDGNSTILFWVDKPMLDTVENTIRFAGFTPGGFQGRQPLFSVVGDFIETDLNKFAFIEVRALGNDGLGTVVPVKLSVTTTTIETDIVSPEIFSPVISKSQDDFDNSYFVSFATQDKGAGVDHYEYATSRFFSPNSSNYQKIESPLVLSKEELSQKIYIKALDRSGNERISTLVGPKYYEYMFGGFIIGVLILCALFYILKKFL